MIDPVLREDGPRITDRLLRQFAALSLLIFGGLSVIELYVRHRPVRASVLIVLAAAIGVVGLIRPRAIYSVFYGAMAVTKPIGFVMSRLLLGVLFYVVFAPVAWVFQLTGRDALRRRFDSQATSYWQKRTERTDIRDYLHQS